MVQLGVGHILGVFGCCNLQLGESKDTWLGWGSLRPGRKEQSWGFSLLGFCWRWGFSLVLVSSSQPVFRGLGEERLG